MLTIANKFSVTNMKPQSLDQQMTCPIPYFSKIYFNTVLPHASMFPKVPPDFLVKMLYTSAHLNYRTKIK
jgi:hypothetical protein